MQIQIKTDTLKGVCFFVYVRLQMENSRCVLKVFLFDYSVHYSACRFVHQQHNDKVCRTVNKVKRYACNPPAEHHGRAADKQIWYRAKSTEKQPEQTRNNAVKHSGILFAYKPCDKCQQWPGVKIHHPPYAKTVYTAFDKRKCRHNKQHFAAQNKGEKNYKE